jgi:hypothetical protein
LLQQRKAMRLQQLEESQKAHSALHEQRKEKRNDSWKNKDNDPNAKTYSKISEVCFCVLDSFSAYLVA